VFICALKRRDALQVVDVLRRFRVEGEGAEHDHLRQREQVAGFFQRIGHRALFQRRMLGAKMHDDALAVFGMAGAVQVFGAGQGFQLGELQHLPALAADAGFQQFVAPLVLARGLAGARNARVR
jgi:hypothetical protein